MIHRAVEEALLLIGMQVHGDEAVDAGYCHAVCHQLGADGHAGLVLAVLTGPSEVGHDGVDGAGGGPLGSVHHEQQLHQVVAVGEGALYQEYVLAANAFFIADSKFSVGELGDDQIAERTT